MPLPSVSVVVPALNEVRNYPHAFERIPQDIHEVLLVEDFPMDGTVAVARELMLDVTHPEPDTHGQGKCGGLRSGIVQNLSSIDRLSPGR